MTNKLPEPLRLALAIDAAWLENVDPEVADIEMLQSALRTQHADLLRKDALLRQALDAVENVNTTMPFLVAHELRQAITKELAK